MANKYLLTYLHKMLFRTAAQIEYACVRHRLPQVDGNEYEAKNNEPREISESGTNSRSVR